MNRRIKGGIFIDNAITITDEKRKGFPIYMRALQLLIIITGCYSMVAIWIEALAAPVNRQTVYLTVLVLSVTAFLFMLFPSYDLVKTVLSVLFYGLFVYSRIHVLKNAFFILENLFIERIDDYFGTQSLHYIADMSSAKADITLMIGVVMFPMVILLAYAIIRNRLISLCNIMLLLPVAVTFVFGLIPSEQYLIVYFMIFLYLSRLAINSHMVSDKGQKTIVQRVNMKAALTLSLIGLLLFFLMKAFVSRQDYEDVKEIKEAKTELQTSLLNFSMDDFNDLLHNFNLLPKSKAVGGLNSGELGKVDEIEYNNKEQLRVWAPLASLKESIYLKAYSGSDYTGDSWNGHSKEDLNRFQKLLDQIPADQFSMVSQVSTLLTGLSRSDKTKNIQKLSVEDASDKEIRFTKGQIIIQYKNADMKYIYLPYFTDYSNLKNIENHSDLYTAPATKRGDYRFDYYYGIDIGNDFSSMVSKNTKSELSKFKAYEKLYQDYIYQVYTKLPDDGLEKLKQDFSAVNPQVKGKSVQEKINYVKQYLEDNTEYSLSPGKSPKGKDFVEYFLYENRKGYCSHYTSAATLMLRAMGIPARYVEGYIVDSSDIVKGENSTRNVYGYTDKNAYEIKTEQGEALVRDSSAHAWVEVYIDGCGFVPVEFTPGFAMYYNNSELENMQTVGEQIKSSKLKEAAVITPKPEKKKATEEVKTPTTVPSKEKSKSKGLTDRGAGLKLPGKYDIFSFLLLTFLIVFVVYIIKICLRIHRRVIARKTVNNSGQALFIYEDIEKMLKLCHAFSGNCLEDHLVEAQEKYPCTNEEALLSCIKVAQKARFGKNDISRNELEDITQIHSSLYQFIRNKSSLIKKIYLKIILSV